MNEDLGSAWVNGSLTKLSDATIPATDRGFLFGHSVFETVLVLNGKFILWNEHMERLQRGCAKALIQCPPPNDLLKWSKAVVEHNILLTQVTARKMQLRIVVSGGTGMNMALPQAHQDLSSTSQTPERNKPNQLAPNVVLMCRNAQLPAAQSYNKGISLKTHEDVRPAQLIDVKSCNYLWSVMALEAARDQGFDDALFYNAHNEITESTTANFIWFNNQKRVCSVPLKNNCLPGTTYLCLQRALAKTHQNVLEVPLTLGTLNNAKGGAILSSVRGLVPVQRINNILFDLSELASEFADLNALLEQEQEESAMVL